MPSDKDKTTLVATNDAGVIKGFATLRRNSSEPCIDELESKIELQRLYIDVSSHRQGVGTLLMKYLVDIAKGEGFRNPWLGTWDENDKGEQGV